MDETRRTKRSDSLLPAAAVLLACCAAGALGLSPAFGLLVAVAVALGGLVVGGIALALLDRMAVRRPVPTGVAAALLGLLVAALAGQLLLWAALH
ncbi:MULTISPECIES: hypothetical protein [unclassified Crossiella]|uniref:hypothetical protein n=1 Tax=unclassified Crossiella TaxID=2620835 RepID=UPI0020001484|nr:MULTISPECIES: hypothetical protein [unclassified Crossiella]MCK2240498.1 hypothetical protein [Crossiella sp. S99.2]MCK2253051.1 hypothetical protein [Crossiella sp. S99.1]